MATNQKLKFSTVLLQGGKTATGIKVPDEIIEKLGGGKKPPVKLTINAHTYRSTVAVMGGVFMVAVSAENREAAKIKAGDKIDVTIELDTEERILEIPPALQSALNKNAAAKKKFESLSNSRKKVLMLPVQNAKTKETAERNIQKAIASLV
jgi:Domain of unknown function (DUF1905)/Bacteriocin-protection, YdeI or OmpD-Associated